MRRFFPIALILILAGCDGLAATPEPTPDPTPEPISISGTFTLHAQDQGWSGENCQGRGGYSDIQAGMSLTLRDGSGNALATSRFGPGQVVDTTQCVFEFEFTDVPDADFYAIDAGRRGEITYSRAEMEAANWTVSLDIGG